MWTLKLCVIGLMMLCDDVTYSTYLTEAQCKEAERAVHEVDLSYITSCEKNV